MASNRGRIITLVCNGRPIQYPLIPFLNTDGLVVGIDPGADSSGLSVVREGVIESMESHDLFELIDRLEALHESGAEILLEDIDSCKPTWKKPGVANRRAHDRVSQGVGRAKQTARQIKKRLDALGIECHLIKPLRMAIPGAIKKKMKGTEKAVAFRQLTGWKGGSNQHNRDAAFIALYGNYRVKLK